MRKVGIYARVSKADRGTTSVPVQLADCRARAEQEGWSVVAEYVDEGVSAWEPRRRRPDFERLLQDVAAGRFDTILVREIERLLRQMKDTQRIQELASVGALKLVAATLESDIDFKRARDKDEFRKRASQAEFYGDFLGEKIRETKARQVAAGEYTGGGPAFGYVRSTSGPVVDPQQAAVMHDMVRKLAAGVSLNRITIDLNADGVPTANGSGRWYPSRVRRLLTSDHVAGGRGYPAILTAEEAALARAHLSREPSQGRGRPPARKYALAGMVFCSECGTKLSAGHAATYRCATSHAGCGKVSVRAAPLERHLIEAMVEHMRDGHDHEAHDARTNRDAVEDATPLLDELRDVERQLAELQEAMKTLTISVTTAGPVVQALEERRRELSERLALTLPPAAHSGPALHVIETMDGAVYVTNVEKFFGPHSARDFMNRWAARELTEGEVAQLHDTLASHIVRVDIKPRETRGRSFDPDRVKVRWR